MKQFVKRLACGVLAMAMIGILVGCSREAPSVTTNSDRAPVGYKAIAAMNASAAEKADRSVRTMSQEDKIGQLMCIGLEGTTFDESQKELVRKYRVGGIVLDNDNMESKEQVRAFTKGIRDTANTSSLMDDDGRVFAQLIDATRDEYPMIMVNAVKVPSIDANHPVSLSKPIITDWLRNELGFEGVVMTDDIEVGAAVAGMSIEDYAVRTINAGSDMVILCKHAKHIKAVHDALTQAVENGTISEARLDESVRRIMLMKFSNEQ